MNKKSEIKTIMNVLTVCCLFALFAAPASSGFVEKRETDKKVRELYDRAIQSYYEGDFDRARIYWQQIMKLDKSQKRAARLADKLANMLDEGESLEIESMLNRIKQAYMKGAYSLALEICGQVRLTEHGKNHPLALRYEKEIGGIRKDIIKRDVTGINNKDRLLRLTVNAYFDDRRSYACEYVTYLKQKYADSRDANALYKKISEAYSGEMTAVNILNTYADLVKQYIGQGIDEFRRPGDAMVSRGEHIRRAGEYYDKALKLNPANMEVFILKGLIEVEKRDFAAAIRLWEKALKLNRQKASAKINNYIFEDDIIKRYFRLFTDTEKDVSDLGRLRARTRRILR